MNRTTKMRSSASDRAAMRAGLLAAPMILWSLLFVGATIGYIIVLSFLRRTGDGRAVFEFTLDNYKKLLSPLYLRVIGQTLLLGVETTAICVLIGYPFGLWMARVHGRMRTVLLLLVIVPFWTNALVRIYGWRLLLVGNGIINGFLKSLGIITTPLKLMNNHGAVLLGMVYGLLPFMILPCYSSAEKLDRTLVDVGRDLGAKPWKVFLTVELPLTRPGLLAGCVLVFVPSLALFFISDLMGGTGDVYIANVVNDQLLKSRDWPFAAALSCVLLAVTAIVMAVYRRSGGKTQDMNLF